MLGNLSTMQQALGEENSKNIYNIFTNIGLAKNVKKKKPMTSEF